MEGMKKMKQMIIGKYVNIVRDTDENGKTFYWCLVFKRKDKKTRVLDYSVKLPDIKKAISFGWKIAFCRS